MRRLSQLREDIDLWSGFERRVREALELAELAQAEENPDLDLLGWAARFENSKLHEPLLRLRDRGVVDPRLDEALELCAPCLEKVC